MRRGRVLPKLMVALLVAGVGYAGAPVLLGPSAIAYAASDNGGSDAQLAQMVKKKLNGKKYSEITVSASNGTVTLSGEVKLYAYKADAVKQAKKTRGVQNVEDNIAVGGPNIPDAELQHKLLSRIEVDRVGFGQVFDAIGVSVHNGIATLEGHALGPVAKDSAVSLTRNTPGVKGVVDNIQVAPLSPMDNRIRVQTYRAIYGFSGLRRYDLVPSKPIRISVVNGHVTLYGVVDSQMDKQLAYTRASQVPGVFSVKNDLMVQGQGNNNR